MNETTTKKNIPKVRVSVVEPVAEMEPVRVFDDRYRSTGNRPV
jgi:hypothetical protein